MTPDAWAGFVDALHIYVRRRVGLAHEDDLVGDILLRIVRHQASLATARHPLAWIRRVAANAIIDYYRAQASEHRALEQMTAEPGPTPEAAEPAASGIAACVLPFISELPDIYRDALLLTDIGGMTQATAAQQLGLSTSGMKSRVQRARSKLKQRLLQCCSIQTDRWGGVLDYVPQSRPCSTGCPPTTRNGAARAADPTWEYSAHLHSDAP